jgi:hypothetical protein
VPHDPEKTKKGFITKKVLTATRTPKYKIKRIYKSPPSALVEHPDFIKVFPKPIRGKWSAAEVLTFFEGEPERGDGAREMVIGATGLACRQERR